MKKIILTVAPVILFVAIFYWVYTTRQEYKALLSAEKLMDTNPDSAYLILGEFKNSGRLTGENRALYALLATRTQFKHHIPISSDSLIRIARDYYKESDDWLRNAWIYFYYGRICNNTGQEKKALDYYQKAANAASGSDNYKLLDLIYNYWGLLLQDKKPYDEGIAKLKESLKYSQLRKDTLGQAQVLADLAWSYVWKEDYKQALFFCHSALSFAKILKDNDLLSSIYNGMGVLYWQNKKNIPALKYINKAFLLTEDSAQITGLYSLKGSIFLDLHQYDSARYYIDKRGLGESLFSKADYYNDLSNLEKELGNYKASLEYRELYDTYYDSIQITKEDAEIFRLQKQYDYSQAQNENSKLKIEKQKRNIFILMLVILVIAVAITAYFLHRRVRRKNENKLRDKEKELKRHLMKSQSQTLLLQQQQLDISGKEEELKRSLQKETELVNHLNLQEERLKEVRLHENDLQQEICEIKKELGEHAQKELELKQSIYQSNAVVKKLLCLNRQSASDLAKSNEKIRLTPEEQVELFNITNICFNDFTGRLLRQFPKLQQEDLYLCCLLKLNLSKSLLLSLMNTTEEAFKKRKQRIRTERITGLKDSNQELTEFLANF